MCIAGERENERERGGEREPQRRDVRYVPCERERERERDRETETETEKERLGEM